MPVNDTVLRMVLWKEPLSILSDTLQQAVFSAWFFYAILLAATIFVPQWPIDHLLAHL
jgi:hypothetical protein